LNWEIELFWRLSYKKDADIIHLDRQVHNMYVTVPTQKDELQALEPKPIRTLLRVESVGVSDDLLLKLYQTTDSAAHAMEIFLEHGTQTDN
jgi:hypothetical protein